MQNNDNQTNQNDPHNRGQNGFEYISPGLCSIWLGMRDSNPRSRDQNPLPYHLANPHYTSQIVPQIASRLKRWPPRKLDRRNR